MDNNGSGPVLVRAAEPESDGEEEQSVNESSTSVPKESLTVPIAEEVLGAISKNTTTLQEKLNKFVNGMDAKIQSV
jgi:hypothetical protein